MSVDAQDRVPETRRSVGISISQIHYDGNDYVQVRDIWFYGDLPAGCLVVSHTLTSAGLIVSGLQGTQYDYVTGAETAVTVDLNVTWVADGPLSNYHYNYHWRYPGEFVYRRGTGKSRDGSATGELTLDGFIMPLIVDNEEAGEEAYVSITSTKDGLLSIGH